MYSATEKLIDWLTTKGYSAYTYPPKSGAEFVTVERTGGSVTDKVDHPTFAIQAWAQSIERAEEMCIDIRDALIVGDVPDGFSTRVDAESMYPWYDESTRLPRYQLVINCTTPIQITNE